MTRDSHGDGAAEGSSREPSFEGRLQLKNYMFSNAAPSTTTANPSTAGTATSGVRRSSRVLKASRPSPQPSPSPSRPSKRRTLSSPTPSPSPRKRRAPAYAPPSTYAHLPLLPDALGPRLLVLFIGLNPGLQTARTGHAYAHPSNLFWKLLAASGITPVPCRASEDRSLPSRFGLGLTNIVARPSRSGAELSRAEMDAGVAALEAKCRAWRPECVCVVGKGIWESLFRVWRGRSLRKGEFAYGWQDERMGAVPAGGGGEGGPEREEEEGEGGGEMTGPWEGAKIFVATSTSGLAATLRPEEKEKIWKVLGDWCVQRRRERESEKEEGGGGRGGVSNERNPPQEKN